MRIFIIYIIVSIYGNSLAQDFHFSQFNENTALLNPALTGATNAIRASVIYKNQWKSITTPYNTFGFSLESKFKASNWENADPKRSMTFKKSFNRLAGGLSVYNDNAGDAKISTLQSNLSLGMFFPLTKLSSLSLGLQGSIVRRKIENSSLIYPNQFNGSVFDPNMPTGETYYQQNYSYPELGAGALWIYNSNERAIADNRQISAMIGFSTYHLNRPKQNYLSKKNDRLYRKYIFHGNVLFGIPHSNIAIVPSWMIQIQGPSKEIVAGAMIKYYLKEDSKYTGIIKRSSIGIGIHNRINDAIIASFLIETGKYAIGLSYDINASSLTKVSRARGGVEISLRFMTASAFLYQKKIKSKG